MTAKTFLLNCMFYGVPTEATNCSCGGVWKVQITDNDDECKLLCSNDKCGANTSFKKSDIIIPFDNQCETVNNILKKFEAIEKPWRYNNGNPTFIITNQLNRSYNGMLDRGCYRLDVKFSSGKLNPITVDVVHVNHHFGVTKPPYQQRTLSTTTSELENVISQIDRNILFLK